MELPFIMAPTDENEFPEAPVGPGEVEVPDSPPQTPGQAVRELEGSSADGWVSEAFGQVYREHSRAIYYLALRLLADPAQAEDATHDIFLKAFRKLSEFRGDSAIRTWLYRIAINHCRNLLQLWHRRHIIPDSDNAALTTTAAPSAGPLRALEIKELGENIQATLDRLPEEYRLLLLLVADDELSYEEVASLTGQTTDAVRGKLHRARKAFAVEFRQLS
jgi:RNA polymerase sigma-70 factor (ECF subfamily)